jgi:hypothetical protein
MTVLSKKNILLLIVLVYAVLFFIIPQTEYLPTDPGIKILQVKDFIKRNYQSFSAVYNGEKLDPEKIFFPVKPAMAQKIDNNVYYQYPFYLTMLYTLPYILFGVYGIVLISLIAGFLTIIVSLKIALILNISERNIRWMLIFLGFASVIPIYSYMVAEYTLSILLVTFSVYLVLLGKEKDSNALYFLAGLSAGISVFFRIELGLFCILFFIGVVLFKIYSTPKSQVSALFISLVLCALVLVGFNYYITGAIFGVRGIDFFRGSGASYTISNRLSNLYETFFISKHHLGLFFAWPIFIFVFWLFIKRNWAKEDLTSVKFLLFIIVLFFIFVPLIVYMGDGSIIGPRFLSSLQALLVLVTFKTLDLGGMRTKVKTILSRSFVLYSIVVILFMFIVLYKFKKISHDVNTQIANHAKNKIVILYDDLLYVSVMRLFDDRMILAINPAKDWKTVVAKANSLGMQDFTVIDNAEDKNSIFYPFKASQFEVKDKFIYDGNYKKIIVENIRINY